MNKRALTLLEIVISTVILALVMTGLVNVFVAGRRLVQHSRYRMSAGELGKRFIDPLQGHVRQDTWGTGSNFFSSAYSSSSSGVYTANYTTSSHPSDSEIKKVKTVVSWVEPR
jgi:Tfp pilus assembly protein PilV